MRNTRTLPYLLIAPSIIFLAVMFFIPLVQTIAIAFRADGAWSFANFGRMADDLDFLPSIFDTLKVVVLAVPLQLGLALLMAMLLRPMRFGRDIVLWIWSIPLGISDLAAGIVWLAILNDRGYLNTVLFKLGLIAGPQSYLTYETSGALLAAIVVAELWRATAIVLVIVVAGLQLLPKEFGEAAEVFGATPWRRFVSVTLPLLKPSIQTALILRTVLAFEMFATVLSLGGTNFPVLASQAFNWQYSQQDYGTAACYAILIMAASLGATALYLTILRVRPERQL
jgi:multiple sugar transport system permease protein